MTVIEEKSSVTLADRLDEIVTTASFDFNIDDEILFEIILMITLTFGKMYNIVHFKYRNPIILC